MRYSTPFVTPKFIAYGGERTEHRLSVAVELVDDFTGQRPAGHFRVYIKERTTQARLGREPIRNLSGYYCFVDVEPGSYSIVVDPGPTSRLYNLKPEPGEPWPDGLEHRVELPLKDPATDEVLKLDLSLRLTLAPASSYPFPPFTTLVRGRVTTADDETPAPFAIVSSEYRQADVPADASNFIQTTAETRADAEGYYALVFRNPRPTNQNLDITASFEGAEETVNQPIHEGSTTAPVDITVP